MDYLSLLKVGQAAVQLFGSHGQDACHGSTQQLSSSRADRLDAIYLRAAQAYMLISMPTGTSTILGVFQVIPSSQEVRRALRADVEPRTTFDTAQVRQIERRTPQAGSDSRHFSPGPSGFLSWTRPLGLSKLHHLRTFAFGQSPHAPVAFVNTRLASTSEASSDMTSSSVSTRSRSATRRLACRNRIRSSALRIERALENSGWVLRRLM